MRGGGGFQCKIGERMGREDGGGHEANPQKSFDISHQSAMLTFLASHFQRFSVSLSFPPRPTSIQGGSIDPASLHVFSDTHTFAPHAGDFFKRQETSLADLL